MPPNHKKSPDIDKTDSMGITIKWFYDWINEKSENNRSDSIKAIHQKISSTQMVDFEHRKIIKLFFNTVGVSSYLKFNFKHSTFVLMQSHLFLLNNYLIIASITTKMESLKAHQDNQAQALHYLLEKKIKN